MSKEHREISRKDFIKLAGIAVTVLTGCERVISNTITPEPPRIPSSTAGNSPETQSVTTSEPTIEPTVTETPEPVLTPERPSLADGLYSNEQIIVIESGRFIDQEQSLADWTKHVWTQGTNRVFDIQSTRLKYVYMFDQNNPENAGVCLESPSYAGVYMVNPANPSAGKGYLPTPTETIQGDIPEGYTP